MSTATLSAQEQENARINAENERLRKQATRKRRIGLGFSYFALILITILMIFPLLIVVLVSFTPNAITQTWPPKLVPNQFTLENYQSLFERLRDIYRNFDENEAQRVKDIEKITNHDVKAVEYFIKEEFDKNNITIVN